MIVTADVKYSWSLVFLISIDEEPTYRSGLVHNSRNEQFYFAGDQSCNDPS